MKPKAAGALCNMMATKMINSTSILERPAAAPKARPSAEGRERERKRERERERENVKVDTVIRKKTFPSNFIHIVKMS